MKTNTTTEKQPIERTCSTCAAYLPDDTDGGHMTCINLVSFRLTGNPGAARGALPDDSCDNHQTPAEDRAETGAIGMFWQRLGIQPQLGRNQR